jgi:DNA-binding NtrC family response regulator
VTDSKRDPIPPTESMPPDQAPIVPDQMILQVIDGPERGRELALTRGSYVVGKDPSCSLVLTDAGVSRQHLELRVSGDGVLVRDLNSRNGTYYQGARFQDVTVGAGAVLALGGTKLKLTVPRSQASLLPSTKESFGGLLGRSVKMREVFALLERVAATDASVLIHGETGTGKEVCAEALHRTGKRSSGPLVICDLAGVSRTLIESELFGHVRGAFTGADRDREGAFVAAHKGTVFIDEVGELELEMQPRLLRALEQRAVKPLGAPNYRSVDVRVIAATNRDLRKEVKEGRFREDLFHRMAVVEVRLPPLRDRREDVPFLVEHFLKGEKIEVLPETMALLIDYDWPGNVRELRNVLERAVSMMGDDRRLTPAMLALEPSKGAPPAASSAASFGIGTEGFKEAKERLIASWERAYATELLKRTGGNVSKAARVGGIDRVSLHRLLKRHGLTGSDEEG